ncbi:unnamed protein product [Phytophthora fragariaefolia]|uniref:Unnamed protein product n=1 Tax=Phytophthora fragariaefolia TaxID=1490495 RepID=A0A9W6XDN2_9STRA|nr:unnamed protein product [Phytophthora fragariaefolia]
MINQRIIDNALWGHVQPRGGYTEKVRRAEAASATQRGRLSDPNQPIPDSVNSVTKFEADPRALAESDPLQDIVNSPESDVFANGEPDESTLTPVFDRRSFVDDICFGGTTFEDCLATLSRLLARANPAKLAAIPELPFPTSKTGMQGFLGALNYYSRFIQSMAVYGAVLYQLKDADFADGGDLAAAKSAYAELKANVANAPILRHFGSAKEVHIMLFTNAQLRRAALAVPPEGQANPNDRRARTRQRTSADMKNGPSGNRGIEPEAADSDAERHTHPRKPPTQTATTESTGLDLLSTVSFWISTTQQPMT